MNTTIAPQKSDHSQAASKGGKTPFHLAYLDGFRGLAALYVLLTHAFATVIPEAKNAHISAWLKRLAELFHQGHFAVDLFIVLSGFCLMLPVVRNAGELRGGALLFFKKRARRILPPYYFALLISLALVWTLIGHKTGTHWDVTIPVTTSGLIAHLLLIQDLSGRWYSQANHVMWSIAVEWQIYFLFPLLLIGWRRLGGIATVLGAVSISYALVLLTAHTDLVGITVQYIALFTMGMLGASISFDTERWDSIRQRVPWGPLTLALGFAVLVLIAKFPNVIDRNGAYVDFLVGLLSTALLIFSSLQPRSIAARFASWRPIALMGTFGYSIYLIHAPLVQVIWQYLLHPMHLSIAKTLGALILLGTPAILAMAYLFFLACERPFMNTRPAAAAPREEPQPQLVLSPGEKTS